MVVRIDTLLYFGQYIIALTGIIAFSLLNVLILAGGVSFVGSGLFSLLFLAVLLVVIDLILFAGLFAIGVFLFQKWLMRQPAMRMLQGSKGTEEEAWTEEDVEEFMENFQGEFDND